MVSKQVIDQQLYRIGFNPLSWGRTEVRELCNVMMDDEEIIECVNGEYSNGFALLVATNHRVLLVDKKPFLYLTIEDLRFEQISDFNFRNRFLTANLTICTSNKTLQFTSYNKKRLRHLVSCVQQSVVALRQRRDYEQRFGAAVATRLYERQPAPEQAPEPAALAAAPQARPAEERPAASVEPERQVAQPPQHPHLSKIATYTRSKLPSLHLKPVAAAEKSTAQSGDVYQRGYMPGSVPDYQAPA